VFTASFFAYWAYIGYAAATFVAGEVKEASRSLPRAILISGVIIMAIYMTISFVLARAGSMAGVDAATGFSLLDAAGFLAYGGGSYADAGLPSIGAWMPTFAGIVAFGQFGAAGGRLFAWLLLAFGALWVANDIPPFILTCSRMMFAMGFDRILPEWVADVSERWASPVNAIIVTSVAALLGVVAEAEWISSAGAVVATDLWDALFFSGVALSCALFPSKMPEVFERSPFRQSKTVVQVLGWVAFVANVALSLLIVFHENAYGWGPIAISTPLGTMGGNFLSINFWFTIVLIVISLGVYYWGRSRAQRIGADLTTIFAEIPPE
jgi:APA family basic amino acid/polyamine antiporter